VTFTVVSAGVIAASITGLSLSPIYFMTPRGEPLALMPSGEVAGTDGVGALIRLLVGATGATGAGLLVGATGAGALIKVLVGVVSEPIVGALITLLVGASEPVVPPVGAEGAAVEPLVGLAPAFVLIV
jgi:hypothetical protein